MLQTRGMEKQIVHSYFFDAAYGTCLTKLKELKASNSEKERYGLIDLVVKNLGFMEEAVNLLDKAGIDTMVLDKRIAGCMNTLQRYK